MKILSCERNVWEKDKPRNERENESMNRVGQADIMSEFFFKRNVCLQTRW